MDAFDARWAHLLSEDLDRAWPEAMSALMTLITMKFAEKFPNDRAAFHATAAFGNMVMEETLQRLTVFLDDEDPQFMDEVSGSAPGVH